MDAELDAFQTALHRLVDRLGLLPERHWAAGYDAAAMAVQELRTLTVELGDLGPGEVPRIAARAAGAQVAVIGADFLRTAALCRDRGKARTATRKALAAVTSATSALP